MSSGNNNIGDQFRQAVNDALNSGDFSALNQAINEVGQSINKGINEAENQAVNFFNNASYNPNRTNYADGEMPEWQRRQVERRQREAEIRRQQAEKRASVQNATYGKKTVIVKRGKRNSGRVNKTGKNSYSGKIVWGIITLFIGFPMMAEEAAVAGVIFTALAAVLLFTGIRGKKRLERALKYAEYCGDKLYVSIEDLAEYVHVSKREVTNDLKMLLKNGYFPHGHLDPAETTFMLTDELYAEAKEADKARREREMEEAKAAMGRFSAFNQENAEPDSELTAMVREGSVCIGKLRALNDRIEGEVISEKLFKLEDILKQIFATVQDHPEQMHKMHKLMDYYLPTTIKLVEAYEEYDNVLAPGKEIVQAKEQIENTLDTINTAFTELLNSLFSDSVIDVTTDAQVLQTMLAQEGLGGNNNTTLTM